MLNICLKRKSYFSKKLSFFQKKIVFFLKKTVLGLRPEIGPVRGTIYLGGTQELGLRSRFPIINLFFSKNLKTFLLNE